MEEKKKWEELCARVELLELEVDKLKGKKNVRDAKSKSDTALVKDVFLKSFEAHFRMPYPGFGAREMSQAKSWLRSVTVAQAIEYCKAYPLWADPWVTEKGHPFGILVAQYVQLDAWMKRGNSMIKQMAKGKAFRQAKIAEAVEMELLGVYTDRELRSGDNQKIGHSMRPQIQEPPEE